MVPERILLNWNALTDVVALNMHQLKVLLLFLCCPGCLCIPNTTRVYFESRNFQNVLHWDQVNIPGETVQYSVEYSVYGSNYKAKTECQNITALSCDLSSETPRHPKQLHKYSARLSANGRHVGVSQLFNPQTDTIFGAPIASVKIVNESVLTVEVELPKGPNNRTIKEIICHLTANCSQVSYTVILQHNSSANGQMFSQAAENKQGRFVFDHLDMNTEYCGTVKYNLALSMRPPSAASNFCVKLKGHPSPWLCLFVLPIGISLLLITAIPLLLWRLWIRKWSRVPESLAVTLFTDIPVIPYSKEHISKIEVWRVVPGKLLQDLHSHDVSKTEVTPQGGNSYSPQEYNQLHGDTYTNQKDTSAVCSHSGQSSPIYSTVSAAQVLLRGGEEGPPRSECMKDNSSMRSYQNHDIVVLGPSGGPLVLPTSQTFERTLQLSSLLLPADSEQDCLLADTFTVDVSPARGQGAPLLADLTFETSDWLDPEPEGNTYMQNNCVLTSSYRPSSIPLNGSGNLANPGSDYRLNWTPPTPYLLQGDSRFELG
ncbi:interferon lambda receptor 1 [Denticeps clupeoides]|uniref:Fibronectin type-III domain-containing protein n=1 Tax=Denticeps clupeoides TaxID=299321 RepID=A0AAY4BHT3_9TELE|nr:interleukin-20 receptor subunit alpha-like [Denticeps clupeoides]